jgi:membrane associated rhomboid family serine protease
MVFIPIKDFNRRIWIRFHYVTVALLGVTILVFFAQASESQQGAALMLYRYGLLPVVLFGSGQLDASIALLPAWASLITSMFLHGGFMHIAGNMLFLWVFGDNVEDSMGHRRFVVFYLVCGVAAGLAHAMANPASELPMVGASGAISGILGAYFVLHPKVKVWVLMFAWLPLKLPTYVILGGWIALQVFNSLNPGDSSNVAWWAHIAGFAAGALLIRHFKYPHVSLWDTSEGGEMKVGGLRLRSRHKWGGEG